MKRFILTILSVVLCVVLALAEGVNLSLDDAIARARSRSVDAAEALDQLRSAYWEWRSFRADQLPELSLNATAPYYGKQYSSYLNSNGSYSFVRTNMLEASMQLSVKQNIPLTGGTVAVNTSLDFLRSFDINQNRYMSIPVALTLSQPLFAVNNMKWDRRIEPVRYSEAKAAFLSASEDVAALCVEYYFDLLMGGENLDIARQNLENASKLYAVAQEKRQMGQISKNDLLQMELNMLQAKASLTDAESAYKAAMFQLRSFLDYGEDVDIVPEVPRDVPRAEIPYNDALDKALTNNKFVKTILRRQLEADYEVAKAKGDMREIKMFVQLGFTGTDDNFSGAYRGLKDNQIASVGFAIPLVDWGRRRGKVKKAESRRRVTQSEVSREKMEFSHDLFILVERFDNQQRQVDIAAKAAAIAEQRYDTNVETYLIGALSTLELNDSRVSKDTARRDYITQLYKFWNYWYRLRSLTLHDYSSRQDINADIDKLMKMQ